MYKLLTISAACALLALTVGCAPTAESAPSPPPNSGATAPAAPETASAEGTAKPVNLSCPVEVGQAVNPNLTVEYDGKTYAFCCNGCPPKFEADPAKYLANFDPTTPPTKSMTDDASHDAT